MTRLPIDSPAVAHGVGLFETMLVLRGRILQLDDHYQRLRASCDALGFPHPKRELFLAEAQRLSASVRQQEAALRCVWVAGERVDDADGWRLGASVGEVPRITRARRELGRAITLDASFVRSLPLHKSTSYAVCVVGLRQAAARNADEALFLTREGLVLEGTSTNVFAVQRDALVTAPLAAGILPGVVREWVFSAASRLGISIDERPPSIDELREGAFLTSSLTTLAELRVLNGLPCAGAGGVYGRLYELWRNEFMVA